MSPLRTLYLALTVIGFLASVILLAVWMMEADLSLKVLWEAHPLIRIFFLNQIILSGVFSVFVISETMVRRDYWIVSVIPASIIFGMAFGLPLYLFLRSRPIQ